MYRPMIVSCWFQCAGSCIWKRLVQDCKTKFQNNWNLNQTKKGCLSTMRYVTFTVWFPKRRVPAGREHWLDFLKITHSKNNSMIAKSLSVTSYTYCRVKCSNSCRSSRPVAYDFVGKLTTSLCLYVTSRKTVVGLSRQDVEKLVLPQRSDTLDSREISKHQTNCCQWVSSFFFKSELEYCPL